MLNLSIKLAKQTNCHRILNESKGDAKKGWDVVYELINNWKRGRGNPMSFISTIRETTLIKSQAISR